MKKIFSKADLQLIAAAAMVIDHASFLVSGYFPAYMLCRAIGRITIVIMSFFVAEGYHRTSNIYKYIIRMGIFAAIAQIPFWLFSVAPNIPMSIKGIITGNYYHRNVIFTLFIALCLLTLVKSRMHPLMKAAAVCAALRLTRCSDWSFFCILWVLAFGCIRGSKRLQMKAAAGIVVFRAFRLLFNAAHSAMATGYIYISSIIFAFVQLGGFIAVLLLCMYNGERGNAPKYGLYIFYPAHLLLLFIIKMLVY